MTKQEYMAWKWGAFSDCGHSPMEYKGRTFYLLQNPHFSQGYLRASAISKEAFDAADMDEELELDATVWWEIDPNWDEDTTVRDWDYMVVYHGQKKKEEEINLTEAEKEEIYNQVCEDLGYRKECRFIEIEDDGRISFTCGHPEEVKGLYWKVINSGKYKPSKDLERNYFNIVPRW